MVTGPAAPGNTVATKPRSRSASSRSSSLGSAGSSAGMIGSSVTGPPSGHAHAVAPQDPARHERHVDLVGPIVDPGRALVRPPPRERRLVGHPKRAQRLDGAVEHALERAGDAELDERDLLARRLGALVVDLPGRVQHHEARRVDLGAALRDPLLHDLLGAERLARRQLAGDGVAAHDAEGALADPDPAHAVVDAPGPEPLLRDDEPGALLAEEVRGRDAAARVAHLAVARV